VWESHEASIVAYARGLVDHDQAAVQQARQQLAGYPARIAQYMQTVTSGAVPASATEAAVGQHVSNQLALADRMAAGDVAGSYEIERTDYGQLYRLATLIAQGVATTGGTPLPADFDSPQRRLTSALGQLLGEHWALAVDLMRAAPSGGKTFDAVANEVNRNSEDLGSAMGVLFGAATGQKFLDLWGSHVDALVTYAQASASGDSGQRQAALDQLHAFETNMSALLNTGTDGKLAAPPLIDALGMHDQMLRDQYDAFTARNFTAAYNQDYDGFQHMFAVSASLAAAIGPEIAARLPVGGVHTGGGWLALQAGGDLSR
jgi:hypothetical protein